MPPEENKAKDAPQQDSVPVEQRVVAENVVLKPTAPVAEAVAEASPVAPIAPEKKPKSETAPEPKSEPEAVPAQEEVIEPESETAPAPAKQAQGEASVVEAQVEQTSPEPENAPVTRAPAQAQAEPVQEPTITQEKETVAPTPSTPEQSETPPPAPAKIKPSQPTQSAPQPQVKTQITPQGRTSPVAPQSSAVPFGTTFSRDFVQKLLVKARAKIQEKKRKKLDKIMTLFEANDSNLPAGMQVTNKDVQKLLRTSRVSAFRYLDILEKQNRIKQVGNTGKSVFYTKN